ncbi:MAG TPA: SOS response-associated peptidase [Solirubrobacteraceae bacterium]|jgi:putative SOS response-associated peptidase YedK|nr:SOS response-associated peptidase [Solirubrobacteraceae bacterium]
MCGRYSLAVPNPAQLRARFPIGESIAVQSHHNIAPGSDVLTVTTDRDGQPRGELLRWGLVPSWAEKSTTGFKMINARAETLMDRAAYRKPFERFRCLIPADGFYEWQPIPAEKRKQPFHITRADGRLFAFAGLWSVWHRGEPDELRSCTIITTGANERIAKVHDRMPVILEPDEEAFWLQHDAPLDALQALLRGPSSEEIALRPVGPAVNDVRYDGPECLLDPPPAAQESLFG